MNYKIMGEPTPVVICNLDAGEGMITQNGAMVWMSPNMSMDTNAGGMGKAFGRLFSGETIFQNTYTAQGGPGMIAFAASVPGTVRAVEITPDKPVVIQKSAFLCSQPGVDLSIFFQKKAASGFFSGEGFIMQKLSGQGMAFLEIDGYCVEYDLQPGQQILVNTGNVAMMDATCALDVVPVKGVKNMFFGGEGLFNTLITGPGRLVLQTMPLSGLASAISRYIPTGGNN